MIYIEDAVSKRLGYVPEGAIILSQPMKRMASLDFVHPGDVAIVFKTQDAVRAKLAGRSVRVLSFESGFFKDSYILDANGVFEKSSINAPGVLDMMHQEVTRDMFAAAESYKRNALPNNLSRLAQVQHPVPVNDGFVLIPDQVQSDSKVKSVHDNVFNNNIHCFFTAILKAVETKTCVIKKHPQKRRSQDVATESLARLHTNCTYGDFSLCDCIARCSMVITYNSLLAFDAMQMDKPIIQMAPGYLYTYKGCVTFCTDINRLTSALCEAKSCINIKERRLVTAFALGRYCFKQGNARYIEDAISGKYFWTKNIT